MAKMTGSSRDWPKIAIGELLPDEAIVAIRNAYLANPENCHAPIKDICHRYEAILLEHGILADYAAYAIEHALRTQLS